MSEEIIGSELKFLNEDIGVSLPEFEFDININSKIQKIKLLMGHTNNLYSLKGNKLVGKFIDKGSNDLCDIAWVEGYPENLIETGKPIVIAQQSKKQDKQDKQITPKDVTLPVPAPKNKPKIIVKSVKKPAKSPQNIEPQKDVPMVSQSKNTNINNPMIKVSEQIQPKPIKISIPVKEPPKPADKEIKPTTSLIAKSKKGKQSKPNFSKKGAKPPEINIQESDEEPDDDDDDGSVESVYSE